MNNKLNMTEKVKDKIKKSKIKTWLGKIINELLYIAKENSRPNLRNVEVYQLKAELYTPLHLSEDLANCKINDYVIIIDDLVWIHDENDKRKEQYAEAGYTARFVRLNPQIFKKLT